MCRGAWGGGGGEESAIEKQACNTTLTVNCN